jgi:hypothetical protein
MRKKERREPEVVWQEERQTLTLDGEPVLEYTLCWPEITGGGLAGRWMTAYYRRLARSWRLRWRRDLYWKACLELTSRRAAARPFTPWTGCLSGEVTHWEDGLLGLRMRGEEEQGDGRPYHIQWDDQWNVREGTPCAFQTGKS